MKVNLKFKLIGVAKLLTSADSREFETCIWHIRRKGIWKDIFCKKQKVRLICRQIRQELSKVGDCSRGRPEGSLFNSYYTEV